MHLEHIFWKIVLAKGIRESGGLSNGQNARNMKLSILTLVLSLIVISGSAQTTNTPPSDKTQFASTTTGIEGKGHHFRGGKKKQGNHGRGHHGHGRHKGRHRHHRSH